MSRQEGEGFLKTSIKDPTNDNAELKTKEWEEEEEEEEKEEGRCIFYNDEKRKLTGDQLTTQKRDYYDNVERERARVNHTMFK